MGYGIKLKVWGDYACFTRPEMKAERMSYDVMTPSAARGVLEAIHWKPAIRWVVDGIHVLNEIRFDNIRRNEVDKKAAIPSMAAMNGQEVHEISLSAVDNRQQRATLMLRDVAYMIEAHFDIVKERAGIEDTEEKHYNIALRRMRKGQCYHRPYLGCREFPAHFELVEGDILLTSFYSGKGKMDLGWILNDIVFDDDKIARFFYAEMVDGHIDVPSLKGGDVIDHQCAL